MKSLLIAIAILCALPSQVLASTCPSPPVPLRLLVPNSEYILIGRITSIEETTVENYTRLTATFEVNNVLQGRIKSKTISLYLDNWMELQLAESESDEGRMLVFINASEDDVDFYYPSAFRDSYKKLDEQGLNAYRQRIKELQGINAIKDEKRRDQLTVDWLINCATNRYTYWEGAYDLSPAGSFLEYYDYETDEFIPRIKLSFKQKQRIRASVLSQTKITYIELGLIMTLVDGPDPELLRFMMKTLKSTATEYLYRQQGLMRQITVMSERQDLSDALAEINTIDYDDDYEKRINKIAQTFINKL